MLLICLSWYGLVGMAYQMLVWIQSCDQPFSVANKWLLVIV